MLHSPAIIFLIAAVALQLTALSGGFPARVLHLERGFPANQMVEMEVLRARDRARHARILMGSGGVDGVLDFVVEGTSDPYLAGCSTYQSGALTKSTDAVDGIFGFGQQSLSVVSQLSSRGITPRAFSHCLKGDGNGGGILVLGEILHPSIVYSPLVPSQPHYNLELQSIAIDGQLLPIDREVFATSNNHGTIIDSGTTLAYLVEEAYDPFVSGITAAVSQSVRPIIYEGSQCYMVYTSLSGTFPPVSLNFVGDASMILRPEEYLIHKGFADGAAIWCMGFHKAQDQVTVLGDEGISSPISQASFFASWESEGTNSPLR